MSKFLSGRQSNLKLGVVGYTENKTVLETTGKVGIGTTDAQSYSLFVVGDTNVTGLVSATDATTNTLETKNLNVVENTTLDDLNVTGFSTFLGLVNFGDQIKARFGEDFDLEIYHSDLDNNNYIDNSGSGDLYIRSGTLEIQNLAGSKTSAIFNPDSGQELYFNNSKKFETTGIGVSIYDTLNVGTGVTIYGNTGIVSATAFYGDGSNLENTGATLSAAAGTQRLVVTSLTSGTMVDAATDSDLTFNATTNTLNTENLVVAGNLTVSGDQTILNVTQLEVEDINIGIASASTKLSDAQLDGAGITIHGSQDDKTLVWDNSNSRMAFSTDVYAPRFYGDGSNLTNTGATLNPATGTQRLVLTSLTSGTMVNAATDSDLAYDASNDRLIVSNIDISGIATLGGPVTAGSSEGVSGQYLRHVGTGVTWASFPPLRTTQTNVATDGQTVFNFDYNANFLDVFVNGIKLTGNEFTAVNGTSVTLASPAFVGDLVEFHSYRTISANTASIPSLLGDLTDVTITGPAEGETLVYDGGKWVNDYAATASTTTTSQTSIHTLSASVYRSVEYMVQVDRGAQYHLTKILVVHDGTTAYKTEYGTIYTGSSLGTFDVDISGGNIRLLATASSSSATSYKIKFTPIKV